MDKPNISAGVLNACNIVFDKRKAIVPNNSNILIVGIKTATFFALLKNIAIAITIHTNQVSISLKVRLKADCALLNAPISYSP